MTTFCIRGGAEANKECVEAERRATAAARWSSVSLRYVKLFIMLLEENSKEKEQRGCAVMLSENSLKITVGKLKTISR